MIARYLIENWKFVSLALFVLGFWGALVVVVVDDRKKWP